MTKEQTQILEDYIKDVEAYWQAVSRKEEPSIDAIFYQNLKTVIELAQDFALDEDDMMELIQEGCVGLLEAIVAHEQGKKKPFSTLVENILNQISTKDCGTGHKSPQILWKRATSDGRSKKSFTNHGVSMEIS